MTPSQSDQTKIAVLNTKLDNLSDDVREVKSLVGEKIATKEYVDDRINPLKRLVWWILGGLTSLVVGFILTVVSILVGR